MCSYMHLNYDNTYFCRNISAVLRLRKTMQRQNLIFVKELKKQQITSTLHGVSAELEIILVLVQTVGLVERHIHGAQKTRDYFANNQMLIL